MRAILGVLSLLVVVAVVGVLAKKQLAAGVAPAPALAQEQEQEQGAPHLAAPSGAPGLQVRQLDQAVQGALQPRAMPDEGQ
jgi:hypothetical protein